MEAVLVKTTNSLLLGKVAAKSNSKFWDQVTKERHRWDEMLDKQADPARSKDRIHWMGVVAMSFARYPRFYATLWGGFRELSASAQFLAACHEQTRKSL